MLDYPDIVMSKSFLYITTNVFKDAAQGKGSVTLRIPLDDLRDLKPLNFDIFNTAPLTNAAGFGTSTFGSREPAGDAYRQWVRHYHPLLWDPRGCK